MIDRHITPSEIRTVAGGGLLSISIDFGIEQEFILIRLNTCIQVVFYYGIYIANNVVYLICIRLTTTRKQNSGLRCCLDIAALFVRNDDAHTTGKLVTYSPPVNLTEFFYPFNNVPRIYVFYTRTCILYI